MREKQIKERYERTSAERFGYFYLILLGNKNQFVKTWGNSIVSLLQLVHALAAIIISMQAEHRITQFRY